MFFLVNTTPRQCRMASERFEKIDLFIDDCSAPFYDIIIIH